MFPEGDFDWFCQELIGLVKEVLQVGRLQMLVERLLVGPVFIKEEMCLIVARLVHVVVDAAGLSTSGREKLQQLLLDLNFLARLGLDPSNNGNLFVLHFDLSGK